MKEIDYNKLTLEELKDLANCSSDYEATFRLAKHYFYEEQEYKKALYYFNIAANNGYIASNYYIGIMLANGHLGEVDYKGAFSYFINAAIYGVGEAILELGYMYYDGLYVEENKEIAIALIKTASSHLVKGAQEFIKAHNIPYDPYEKRTLPFDCSEEEYRTIDLTKLKLINIVTQTRVSFTYLANRYLLEGQYRQAYLVAKRGYRVSNGLGCYNVINYCLIRGYFVDRDTKLATENILKALEKNPDDDFCNYFYGERLLFGDGVEQNIDEGFKYFKKALDNYYGPAHYLMGRIYEEGLFGRDRSYPSAYYHYLWAIQKDSPFVPADAYFYLGRIYEAYYGEKDDIAKAKEYYRLGSEKGSAPCSFSLARFYQGVDDQKAYELMLKAQKNSIDEAEMAIVYYNSIGIGKKSDCLIFSRDRLQEELETKYKDGYKIPSLNQEIIHFKEIRKKLNEYRKPLRKKKSKYFFMKENELLSPIRKWRKKAQEYLAFYYYRNEEYESAYEVYSKLIKRNSSNAYMGLGYMYLKGHYVKKDQQKAFNYFKKATEMGNYEAMAYLASFYYDGIYVDKDENSGNYYLYKSVNANDPAGNFHYGLRCYNNNENNNGYDYIERSARQGYARALEFLATQFKNDNRFDVLNNLYKAACMYNARACHDIASFYYYDREGSPFERDKELGFAWFKYAARYGSSDGEKFMGNYFRFGYYGPQDRLLAIYFYRKAANHGDYQASVDLKNMHV